MTRKLKETEEKRKKEEEDRRIRIERGLENESDNGDGMSFNHVVRQGRSISSLGVVQTRMIHSTLNVHII